MCGIAGFVAAHPLGPDARSHLGRMCHTLVHRGPDDEGMAVVGRAALGMRRLSIIDLSGGHQPISSEDGRVTIVFNGEVYNFRALRAELESRGHRFSTSSDTEAVVHAYEQYGCDCVLHLRGMFAFAIWDDARQRLFLARDRVGKKPLFYSVTANGTLVFGSELKALLAHPGTPREVDPEAIDAYLTFGYVPDPSSIFGGVKKLPPGHFLTFESGEARLRQYWDLRLRPGRSGNGADYVEELRSRLEDAVRVRLMSDVPLGAFLSGGIDSSTVVGYMTKAMDRPVKTFSIGFDEDSYDELKYARVAARHFGTEHHEFVVTPEICDCIEDLVWHCDEPFADSSIIPTYAVSRLARQHVTVALSGDGGDELFAGYTRYVVDRRRSAFGLVPGGLRAGLRAVSGWLPHGARGRNLLYNLSLDEADRYIDSIALFSAMTKRTLYQEDFGQSLEPRRPERLFRDIADASGCDDTLDCQLYLDTRTYLPGDILTKVDRMSMAASLETRAPLLDQELIEFVATIPPGLKLRGLETKHVLREAVRTLVPSPILTRAKQGFGVPIEHWINRQLRTRIRETLSDRRTRERGYVRQRYVDVLLDEHERGRRDHSMRLWALFVLELWHRAYCDGNGRSNVQHHPSPAPNTVSH